MSTKIYGHLAVLKLLQIIAYDSTLSPTAKRICMILAGYADNKDYSCFPSASRIGKTLGVSRQAVTKQIDILEKHGYIKKEPRFDKINKARKSNILIFNISIALDYHTQPDIFCKKNIALLVTYLATTLGYGELQSQGVVRHEPPKGCTKRTLEKNKYKRTIEKNSAQRAVIRAHDWERANKHEKNAGVTKKEQRELTKLHSQLKNKKGRNYAVNFVLQAQKVVNKLDKTVRASKVIDIYKNEIKTLEKQTA